MTSLSILPPDGVTLHLTRIPVVDDASCAKAMELYAHAKRLIKLRKERREARLYEHKKAIAEVNAEYKPGDDLLAEVCEYEKDQVAQHESAKADLAAALDFEVPTERPTSAAAEVVNRKVNKVRILNKEGVPEEFKVVDEDKILQAYERLGTVPLGVHASGSFEVYEETVTTLRRKY